MVDLTIHDLDEDVIETLEMRAARHGRGLEEEARAILVNAARTPTPEEVRVQARRIAAMTPPGPRTGGGET
jgi:plasmid stability protein